MYFLNKNIFNSIEGITFIETLSNKNSFDYLIYLNNVKLIGCGRKSMNKTEDTVFFHDYFKALESSGIEHNNDVFFFFVNEEAYWLCSYNQNIPIGNKNTDIDKLKEFIINEYIISSKIKNDKLISEFQILKSKYEQLEKEKENYIELEKKFHSLKQETTKEIESLENKLKYEYVRNNIFLSDLIESITADQFIRINQIPFIEEKENKKLSKSEVIEISISKKVYENKVIKVRVDFKYFDYYEGDNEIPRGNIPHEIRKFYFINQNGETEDISQNINSKETYIMVDFSN